MPETKTQPTFFIYHLELSKKAHGMHKPPTYSTDACYEMIIVAQNDIEARNIAIKKEWGGKFPGINMDTARFWGPTIEEQIPYIDCIQIGISFSTVAKVITTNERHDTG